MSFARKAAAQAEENFANNPTLKNRNALIVHHEPLIRLIIKNHFAPGADIDMNDLIQEGYIGLMIAANRFDPSKGCKFITYASWQIRGQIGRYLQHQAAQTYCCLKRRVANGYRDADIQIPLRLDKPAVDDDDRAPVVEIFNLNNELDQNEDLHHAHKLSKFVNKEVLGLAKDDREIDIINTRLLRHDKDMKTLAELGKQYSISREAVRLNEIRLMKRIKAHFETNFPELISTEII